MRFIPGALECIASINRAGKYVLLVTNQAGIARGYYDWDAFERVQQRIDEALAAAGGRLDGVWACGFHPDGKPPLDAQDHPFRKPNPGMIQDALQVLPIDAARSWLVGDKVCDIEAGIRAGLKGAIHVRTGHGGDHRGRLQPLRDKYPGALIAEAESLSEAATLLLGNL